MLPERTGSAALQDQYLGILGEFGDILHQYRQEYSQVMQEELRGFNELSKAAFHNYDDPLGTAAAFSIFLRLEQRESSKYDPFLEYEFFSPVVEMLSERVCYAARRSPRPLQTNVFVGEIPGSDFNAGTLPRPPYGSLILVNSGLPLAIHQLSKIVGLGSWFSGDDHTSNRLESDIRSGKMIGPQFIDLLTIVLQYAIFRESRSLTLHQQWKILATDDPADRRDLEALYKFIENWRSVAIRPEIDPYSLDSDSSASRRRFVGTLDQFCLSFVLAHEFGHVIAGHATSSVSKEYDADSIAAEIMYTLTRILFQRCNSDSETRQFVLNMVVLGASIFFDLDDLVEKMRSQVSGSRIQQFSHPPSKERASRMEKKFRALAGEEYGYDNQTEQWFRWLRAKIGFYGESALEIMPLALKGRDDLSRGFWKAQSIVHRILVNPEPQAASASGGQTMVSPNSRHLRNIIV